MNHAAIIKRLNKAIANVEAKTHAASVHMIDEDTETEGLSGLVVILSNAVSTLKNSQDQNTEIKPH